MQILESPRSTYVAVALQYSSSAQLVSSWLRQEGAVRFITNGCEKGLKRCYKFAGIEIYSWLQLRRILVRGGEILSGCHSNLDRKRGIHVGPVAQLMNGNEMS